MIGNRRRILVLTIVVLLLSMQLSYATNLEDIGTKLKALGLMVGDPNGNMRFQDNITRAEFAAIAVRLIGKEKDAIAQKGPTKFKDVPKDHWSTGYINVAVANGLIHGYGDTTFKLDRNITFGEATTILVNALGFRETVKGTNWPDNFIAKAKELGIVKDIKLGPNATAKRGDIARMLDNSLYIPLKK